MGRLGRYLEGIAYFEYAGRLTFYGKLETTFHDIGGFDSRMRVSPDRHSRLYCRFHKQRLIAPSTCRTFASEFELTMAHVTPF